VWRELWPAGIDPEKFIAVRAAVAQSSWLARQHPTSPGNDDRSRKGGHCLPTQAHIKV
jgi:hypothetical protein